VVTKCLRKCLGLRRDVPRISTPFLWLSYTLFLSWDCTDWFCRIVHHSANLARTCSE